MSFLRSVLDIIESIFASSSPEVKRKIAVKKIDTKLRNFQPSIYRNGTVLPNFAEVFRILYKNTKTIGDILSETLFSENIHRNDHYVVQLVLTGFSPDSREKYDSLSYETRKEELLHENVSESRVFERQHRTMESLLRELDGDEFTKIGKVVDTLQQLFEVCKFNYINVIHKFDSNYNGFDTSEEAEFSPCNLKDLETQILDFYYIAYQLNITTSVAKAVLALNQLRQKKQNSESETNRILGNLKKINSVLKRILTPEILKKLIQLLKEDPDFTPQAASFSTNAIQKFIKIFQAQYDSDENKIKMEMKDMRIASEIDKLFGGTYLETVEGYDADLNKRLQENSPYTLNWVTPLQILKTFLRDFFDEQIKALLDDIVIEGFFNNPAYKTEFSTAVFNCSEESAVIKEFEDSFHRGNKNDRAIIESYIKDSQKNADFIKKLEKSVDYINNEAYNLAETLSNNIFILYNMLGEILIDSKKAKSDIIANIKVLLSSTRNKDYALKLERQYDLWGVFIEIMKNYVIIGEKHK